MNNRVSLRPLLWSPLSSRVGPACSLADRLTQKVTIKPIMVQLYLATTPLSAMILVLHKSRPSR